MPGRPTIGYAHPVLGGWVLCVAGMMMIMPPRPAGAQSDPEELRTDSKPRNRATLVGDASCFACHQDKVDRDRPTAHARTTSWPSRETIKGNVNPGANVLQTPNPNLRYVMEAPAIGFVQTAWLRTSPTEVLNRSEMIGVVVGSGRKGQTYLYWAGDGLFQLPVYYWTEVDCWINRPGYPDTEPHFERPTPARCLECHATSFDLPAPPGNRYDKASLVPGISCEKCHGPGSEHVARFTPPAIPPAPGDSAIINPAKLSRDRQIDVCALCHAGPGRSLTSPLSFKPGDVLAQHVVFPPLDPKARLDVQASQFQLMELSRCFQSAATMTCSTCHDVHQPLRDPAAFVSRCLSCHQVENCGLSAGRGHAIENRCVDCHMPVEETNQVVFSADGKSVHPKVRSHRIAIYPERDLP